MIELAENIIIDKISSMEDSEKENISNYDIKKLSSETVKEVMGDLYDKQIEIYKVGELSGDELNNITDLVYELVDEELLYYDENSLKKITNCFEKYVYHYINRILFI